MPDRAALTGIIFVLRYGLPWSAVPKELGCGSGIPCWRRLRDWQQAGVFDRLHQTLLDRLGEQGWIDWELGCLDSARIPAKKGGDDATAVGPNPTDRGKPGTKRHLITDRQGTPLAVCLTGANRHDSVVFDHLLDLVPGILTPSGRRRRRPRKGHAEKAYDDPRCRQALRQRHILIQIARRGIESTQRLGRHR